MILALIYNEDDVLNNNTLMEIAEKLQLIGLTKRESEIYLTLLESGPLTPTSVAQKTKLKRPNIYDIVKSLSDKGLVNFVYRQKRRLIGACPPQILLDKTKNQFDIAKEIMPLLLTLNKTQTFKSSISYFHGPEGIKELIRGYLNSKNKEVWFLVSPMDANNLLGEEFVDRLIRDRIRKGIKIRSLRPAEKENFWEAQETSEGKLLTSSAYVPPKYTFSLSMGIYDDITFFFSSKKEGFGFLIDSPEFTQVMRMFYDNLWNNSGKLNR